MTLKADLKSVVQRVQRQRSLQAEMVERVNCLPCSRRDSSGLSYGEFKGKDHSRISKRIFCKEVGLAPIIA